MANFCGLAVGLILLGTCTALPRNLCNPKQGRIVGGVNVTQGEAPYFLTLYYEDNGPTGTGTLATIKDRQFIITAAHIASLDSEGWFTIAGDIDRTDTSGFEQTARIRKVVVHPDYDIEKLDNDIAIMFLEQDFKDSFAIAPIRLPSQDQEIVGDVQLVGWESEGWSFRVHKLQLPLVDKEVCEVAFGGELGPLGPSLFCAGVIGEAGKGACLGNDAGPVVSVDDGYLTGVVTWGATCGEAEYPDVYTKVSHFIDWIIEEVMKDKP